MEGYYSKTLHHYERVCEEFPDLSNYDRTLQETMRGMLQGIKAGGEGANNHSFLSFDILILATTCLCHNNCQAAKELLDAQGQLPLIARSYFEFCKQTSDSLRKLHTGLLISKSKLMKLHCETVNAQTEAEAFRYAEAMADDFIRSLPDLIKNYIKMLKTLKWRREEIRSHPSEGNARTRRKVTGIVLLTVFAAAVICTILAAALHASPLLLALPAAVVSITSWGPFVKWLNELWEGEAQARFTAMVAGRKKGYINVIEELDIKTGGPSSQSTFETSGERMKAFRKRMTELEKHVETCISDICRTRRECLQKIDESLRQARRRDRVGAFIHRQKDRLERKKDALVQKISENFEKLKL